MFPHERSLVEKLKNEPFALIGVNSDPDREKLKQTLKEKNLTWRSFWDESTQGPIATAWGVQGWPTIYVLDGDRRIRYKNVRDEALEKAIMTLLAEHNEKAKESAGESESGS
jgi:hypothetical protein